MTVVSESPDDPGHNVDILFLELVTVDTIGIPRCAEDADAGSNDTDHRGNRMEGNREPFLELGDDLCDRDRLGFYKEDEDFAPDSGPVPRQVGAQPALDHSLDLGWRSHTFTLPVIGIYIL